MRIQNLGLKSPYVGAPMRPRTNSTPFHFPADAGALAIRLLGFSLPVAVGKSQLYLFDP